MIIRVEKRHVVYVVSVCGILNEGGKKTSCYTSHKLQNIQLYPSSPSLPPSPPGTHTPSIPLPCKLGTTQSRKSKHPSCSPCRVAHLLGKCLAFSLERGAASVQEMLVLPSATVSPSPGRLFQVPKPPACGHTEEISQP